MRSGMDIAFLFTCYNRREKTKACIDSIIKAIDYCALNGLVINDSWYITDAGSNDGTVEMIKRTIDGSKLHIRVEKDDVYYSVGMRMCMEMLLDECTGSIDSQEQLQSLDASTTLPDHYFLVNDDVEFYEDYLYQMCKDASDNPEGIIVGATDYEGKQTYGGVRYVKGVKKNILIPQSIRYEMVKIEDTDVSCHTFNANCVMIPGSALNKCGVMDKKYMHSLGDFDYGLCIYENGYEIRSTRYYVGSCANNARGGSWMDKSLTRIERIRKLNSVKGAPTKYWFYYLKKHFGLASAVVHSVSPYVRIVVGR